MSRDTLLPPYDLDAEEAVLGSVLIDDDAMTIVTSVVNVEDFYSEQNQFVYGAILRLYNRGVGINQITVAQELVSLNKLDDAGGAAYLSHLVSMVPTSLHAKYYAQIVKDTAIRRRLMSAAGQIENLAAKEPDPNVCMAKTDQMLLGIQAGMAIPHLITPTKLAELGAEHYGKMRNPLHRVAVSTGCESLDNITGGLFPAEYWILAARTGLGKSQIAFQISQAVGRLGPVLICPLEMHWKQILDRVTAQAVGVPIRKVRLGGYSDELTSNIFNIALPYVSESNIYLLSLGSNMVDAPSVTISTIGAMARHMKMAYGLSLVVIDYIGLIDPPSVEFRASRAEQVSHISRGIKGIANALEVPILAVAQINREPERRADKRPELSDLRDSGSLEQDADVVCFLYRDDYYDPEAENKHEAEFHIAKQRQGESGIKLIIHWDEIRGRYKEFMY
jgi:replicative DNA helicase